MRGRHLRSRFQVREASDIAVDHRRVSRYYRLREIHGRPWDIHAQLRHCPSVSELQAALRSLLKLFVVQKVVNTRFHGLS